MTTSTQWKKLKTREGSAKEIPEIVDKLIAGGDVDKYNLELETLFINQGQIYSATAPTLDLLLSYLPSAQKPEWVLRAIANVAGADLLRAWVGEPAAIPEEIEKVFEQYQTSLLDMLGSEIVEIRSAVAFAMGSTSASLINETKNRLLLQLKTETEATVIASCLLALSRLGSANEVKDNIQIFSTSDSRLVRGAWGVARIRSDASILEPDIAAAIIDWFSAYKEVSEKNFWWWIPSVRFSHINTFLESCLHHGIFLAELAKAQINIDKTNLDLWTDFLLSIPEKTHDGWALRGASDFLSYIYGMREIEPRHIMVPDQLTESQRKLALRLENSPLCAQAGFGLPASGAVRSRWLGHATPSIMEKLVTVDAGLDGNPGKVPLYWISSRIILGNPGVPDINSLAGFDKWRSLVGEAFGEYSRNWSPPDLQDINNCINLAMEDPQMKECLVSLVDECAKRVAEFRQQYLNPKYWAISTLLLIRPLKKLGIEWKLEWEKLITFDGDPETWIREIIEWIPTDVRERWLWDNLQRMKFELHYVDLLPSTRLIKRSLLAMHNIRKSGKQMIASTIELEKRIYELAKTNPLFATAIEESKAETGNS